MFILLRLLDQPSQPGVFSLEFVQLLVLVLDLDVSCVEVHLQFLLVHDSGLLSELLVGLDQLLPLLLELVLVLLVLGQLDPEVFQLLVLRFVLVLHVLELLSGVTEDNDRLDDLRPELVQLFVSFLDLLVKSLILNLELLEINEMESISKLLLLLKDLLLVGKTVTQGDVLKSVLMHFLVLELFGFFPFFKLFLADLLTSP